ncbi:hypothetical protein PGT21_025223 [Puccinia graminis f. sp. tritici]|uniref:Uncharacterized protein n=1 Tax=Puccinia graminis f. sp. tritici TaxID=56615 RepID=A0A5B0LUC9_PUCGR|nr:hypothetical protein PGT21_025223 [Puccinia graminis f. sp. tritici]
MDQNSAKKLLHSCEPVSGHGPGAVHEDLISLRHQQLGDRLDKASQDLTIHMVGSRRGSCVMNCRLAWAEIGINGLLVVYVHDV